MRKYFTLAGNQVIHVTQFATKLIIYWNFVVKIRYNKNHLQCLCNFQLVWKFDLLKQGPCPFPIFSGKKQQHIIEFCNKLLPFPIFSRKVLRALIWMALDQIQLSHNLFLLSVWKLFALLNLLHNDFVTSGLSGSSYQILNSLKNIHFGKSCFLFISVWLRSQWN